MRTSLESVEKNHEARIADLDAALAIVARIGVLYESLDFNNRISLLREIVERVVVDHLGNIIRVEWHSPFAYIRHITERTLMELAGDRHETSRHSTAGANCSDWFSACGPEGKPSVN